MLESLAWRLRGRLESANWKRVPEAWPPKHKQHHFSHSLFCILYSQHDHRSTGRQHHGPGNATPRTAAAIRTRRSNHQTGTSFWCAATKNQRDSPKVLCPGWVSHHQKHDSSRRHPQPGVRLSTLFLFFLSTFRVLVGIVYGRPWRIIGGEGIMYNNA